MDDSHIIKNSKQHSAPPRQLVVGFVFNKKKLPFCRALQKSATTWTGNIASSGIPVTVKIILLPSNEDVTWYPNIQFDAILHKLTDEMATSLFFEGSILPSIKTELDKLTSCEPAEQKLNHPNRKCVTTTIDSIMGMYGMVDRLKMYKCIDSVMDVCRNFAASKCNVRCRSIPWIYLLAYNSVDEVRRALTKLTFPIIIKHRLGCGPRLGHRMIVTFSVDGALQAIRNFFHNQIAHATPNVDIARRIGKEGLRFPTPENEYSSGLIAQEYLTNHGAVLFKIYAVGSRYAVQARSSVQICRENAGEYVVIDSTLLDKKTVIPHSPRSGIVEGTNVSVPPPGLISIILAEIKRNLGVTLIGIDLLYDRVTEAYALIDINYFPSYLGVNDANDWILQYISNIVMEQQRSLSSSKSA